MGPCNLISPELQKRRLGASGAFVPTSLRNASAKVNRVSRTRAESSSQGERDRPSGGYSRRDADPWAADGPGGYSDEPPF
jgi:hypothetical protein